MALSSRKFAVAFFVSCCIVAAVLVAWPNTDRTAVSSLVSGVFIIVLCIASFVVYFLPSIVAINRKHHQMGPIIVINLLAGWTFIGWVVAAAWSMSATPATK